MMCVMSKAAYSLPYPTGAGQGVGDVQFTLILHTVILCGSVK